MARGRTAKGLLVERLVGALSGGALLRGEVLRLGRLFIAIVFVAELRGTISRAHRQVHTLAAPVTVRELAIEVFGIGWILIAEPVPALPQPVDVGVMDIEHRSEEHTSELQSL